MMSYFAIPTIETIVVEDSGVHDAAVRNSMYHESELFLRNTLWTGKVADLLTSRSRRSTRRWRRSTASLAAGRRDDSRRTSSPSPSFRRRGPGC